MRILIDTNVILDILLEREPFFDSSYAALKRALAEDAECFLSATAVTDVFYLLRKGLSDPVKARESLGPCQPTVGMPLTIAITMSPNTRMTD